jgi:glycosyltransferase involved in cell wall biosynthesis
LLLFAMGRANLKRKLLFVQSGLIVGGAEEALVTLLSSLDRDRYDSHVALLGFGDGPLPQRLAEVEVPCTHLPHARLRQFWALRKTRKALTALATRISADLLVANGCHPHLYSAPAARAAGCRSVLIVHDFPPRGLSVDAFITRRALSRRADLLVAPSEALAGVLRELLPDAPVSVVPNGVDPDYFDAIDEPAARASLSLPEDATVFVLPGRLQPGKGQDVFLQAVALLTRKLPKAFFIIAGADLFKREERYVQRLHELATSLDIEKCVRFAGHMPRLPMFGAADVIVMASVWPESFGMVLLEAGAAGKPTIATRLGGPMEVIEHEVTGTLVEPGNAAELANAMEALGTNPGLRRSMGAAARARVRERFSARCCAGQFETELEKLAW